jgi:DNA-binding NarL/FixJ family response regulator
MTRTRILIADDFPLFRKGVREFLETQPGYEVVGEAATGREALVKAKHLKPHVVILDISMPELNGLEATREILKAVPETEVLILTLHESEDLVHKVLEAGARGYVLKSDAEPTLLEAIEAVRQHKAFFASKVAAMLLEAYLKVGKRLVGEKASPHELTPRERQIVQLLAEGKSNKEVASALEISLHTVVTHRSNIMHKLEVHSVSELVRYAIRNNLVSA